MIEVIEAPNLEAITDPQTLTVDQPILTPIAFTNNGGDVAEGRCSIASGTSVLPAELVLEDDDNGTCHITGTPLDVTDSMEYTIAATNIGGTGTATVTIVVNPVAPNLEAITMVQTLTVDQPIPTPIAFTNNGGDVARCSVASGTTPSALPEGLGFVVDEDGTCRITGTPSMITESMEYTIAATNAGGIDEDKATVTIVVNPQAPVLGNIPGTQTLIVDRTNNPPIVFTKTGGAVAEGGCTIDATGDNPDTLPVGLNVVVSGETCAITGTPTMITELTTYTILATNDGGPSTATVMIVVEELSTPPALADISVTQSFGRNQPAILPIIFINTGGAVAAGWL